MAKLCHRCHSDCQWASYTTSLGTKLWFIWLLQCPLIILTNVFVSKQVFKGNYKNCLSRVPKKCDKWQEVAKELKNKYQSAVKSNNVQQQQLSMGKVFRRNHMQLLVLTYQDSSPDYCQRNVTAGSPGLEGRVCGNDRKKTRHCRSLCRQCGLKLMRERRGSPINTVTVCRQRKRSHQNRKGHNKGNRSP